jgi:hypothetical protein
MKRLITPENQPAPSRFRRLTSGAGAAVLCAALAAVGAGLSTTSPASAAASAGKPKPPVVPAACNVSGDSGDDVFTGAVSNQWGTAGNWSTGQVPGPGDFACIPSTYGSQVVLTGSAAQVVGVNDEAAAGLEFLNSGLTITGTSEASVINGFSFVGGGDPSNLNVDAGAVLDLTGTGAISQSQPNVNGPGTINTIKGSTTSIGSYTGFADGLHWNNWGTFTGVGASLCASSSGLVELTNEPKAAMVFGSGGGLSDSAPWCNSSLPDLPVVLNDAGASVTVSSQAFQIGAPFDNEGTVTDEFGSSSPGLNSGLNISANSGLNGIDTGTYETETSTTKGLGEINFDSARDLTAAQLTGTGTFGFYAIGGGVDLSHPTLASVNQTGTTNGGMTITKGLTFYYSELGYNIQTDTGAPTDTVIDSGASVNFSGWGATMANGHSLVVDPGATFNLAGESVCLSPTSTIKNSGKFLLSGGGNPNVGTCGGSGGGFVNTSTGSLSDSASHAGIGVPLTNAGSVGVTAGDLTVDGNSGKTETGSWHTASGTTLAFASGPSTVTGAFKGSGTVSVDCNTTLGFSGQSFKKLFVAGTTTGDYRVTKALSLTTENECVDYPTVVIPSGTVSIAGDLTPQQYENPTVALTVNGASGSQLSVGQVEVGGTATLHSSTTGVNLSVATAAGVTPAVGQSAQILTAGTTVGNFAFGTTCAGPGVAYAVAPDATGISLDVVSNGGCA